MASSLSRRFERYWPLVWVLAFLAALAVAATWGGPFPLPTVDPPAVRDRMLLGMELVVERVMEAGWVPMLYLAGAIGLGRLAWPFVRLAREFFALQCGFGLALMLTYSHLAGQLGLFASKFGIVFAYLPLGVGSLMLLEQLAVRQWARRTMAGLRVEPLVVMVPLGILLTAACNAPGLLWSSEMGGYDALSYHLELPQEWLRLGRIVPFEHNVYSYLPSYVESAFMHLGVLRGVAVGDGGSHGLLSFDGMPAISCQLFHSFVTLLACWVLSRAVKAVLRRSGFSDSIASTSALIAGGIVLATPWVLVVGSLAYNEMALVLFFSSAVVVTLEEEIKPANRAMFAAFMVGLACAAKPTALLFAGVPIALLLLGVSARRDWLKMLIPGAIMGILSMSPWLIRNEQASGNPVFPAATSVFGRAHWSEEQVQRFQGAHSFHGSVGDRLKLLVMEDPTDPAGARHRGMMHRQWGGYFLLAAVALPVCVWGLRRRGTVDARRLAWIVPCGLASQVVLWLFTTHLQSRFLIPLVVPASCLVGGALAALADLRPGLRVRAPLGLAALLMQVIFTLMVYRIERGGAPAEWLFRTPADFAGLTGLGDNVDSPQRAARISSDPTLYVNFRVLPREGGIYLLGEAAPFYYVNVLTNEPVLIRYATTWDTHPLAQEIAEDRNVQGSAMVLIDRVMLDVWRRSGFGDPRLGADAIERWRLDHTDTVMDWSRAPGDLRRDVQLLRLH